MRHFPELLRGRREMRPVQIIPGFQFGDLCGAAFTELGIVQTKARLSWLLLQNEEPAVVFYHLLGRQVETDKRNVWFERAAKDRMRFDLCCRIKTHFRMIGRQLSLSVF